MTILRRVSEFGVLHTDSRSEKRNIILTNYISLVAVAATFTLLIGRILFAFVNTTIVLNLLIGCFFFLLPILCNFLSFTNVSRIILCWLPSLFQTYMTYETFSQGSGHETSDFVGLRFFLLAFSSFPFLIFDLKKVHLLILGLLGPLFSLMLYDPILNFMGVGYHQLGLHDKSYYFNNVRTFVSFFVIGFSTYFLKRLVLTNEELNERLIAELAQKNKVIRQQGEDRLRVSENKFVKVFQQNPDLMTITRESDKVIYDVNDKSYSVMGYHRDELVGKVSTDFSFFINPEDRKQFVDQYDATGRADLECQWKRKDGRIIYVLIRSQQMEIDGEKYFTSVIKDISDRKRAEEEKETARYALKERVKELTTLYKTSQILQQEKKSVTDVLQDLVEILPPGWQYPEITAASITIEGHKFATKNYAKGAASQSRWFETSEKTQGLLEIVYLETRKEESDGPFLSEERDLINMIAEMLRNFFVHRHEAEELESAKANLYATINNTRIFIWSVDRHYKLLSFNRPFALYMKERYGIEIQSGNEVLGKPEKPELIELEKKWNARFEQVIAGEPINMDEKSSEIDFQYSLSPITEGNKIIGVSVVAEDITERKTRDRELAEANKKNGELRLMALRSVMNPHFIFNVLNSIQFYIVANDRLNAVNYLSTFSKLIRSILTHSVHNKIKLEDEIELLRNYVQLEMVRFENKFSFRMEVDPNLEIDAIEIPSLLVQPFVENAILHGLYNKQGTGVLIIRIKEQGDAIVFEIEDDGIGREAALKLKLDNPSSHKSMGVKLTEERLKLINENHNVSYKVDDLKNGDKPCGTRASIWIKA